MDEAFCFVWFRTQLVRVTQRDFYKNWRLLRLLSIYELLVKQIWLNCRQCRFFRTKSFARIESVCMSNLALGSFLESNSLMRHAIKFSFEKGSKIKKKELGIKTLTLLRVWKGILGIRDLTKIRCGNRGNDK